MAVCIFFVLFFACAGALMLFIFNLGNCFDEAEDASFEVEANEELSEKVRKMVRGETDWVAQKSIKNGVVFYRHKNDNYSGELLHIYGEMNGEVEIRPVYGYFPRSCVMKFYDKDLSSEIRTLSEKAYQKGVEDFCKKL